MPAQPIRFDNGEAYDRMTGTWSRIAGQVFLDWLKPASGQRWVDIGCGSGAFSDLILRNCAPAALQGIDPSDSQLAFARTHFSAANAAFHQGDGMALPYADDSFDIAVMALVLFFVPDPIKGVAEMVRVVRPGGWVTAYVWDTEADGSPPWPVSSAVRAEGRTSSGPPSAWVAKLDTPRDVWTNAGLQEIETRVISPERGFDDFDTFWSVTTAVGGAKAALASLPPDAIERVKARVRAALPPDTNSRITYSAHANAIKGRVPG